MSNKPPYKNKDLYASLTALELIDKQLLDGLLDRADKENLLLGDLILEKDLMGGNDLGRIVAELIFQPFIDLSQEKIEEVVLRIVPEIVAQTQHVVAFKKDDQGLHVAMANPSNLPLIEQLAKKVGSEVISYYANQADIRKALNLYLDNVQESFAAVLDKNVANAQSKTKAEPEIIKIVDLIINFAYQNGASDIHLEPLDESSLVRFRVDGILHDIVNLPQELHQMIVTRIKVLAKLRTDEHQAAQDGKIVYKTDEDLDMRVSVVPVTNGEKVVMRLLSDKNRRFSLADLGIEGEDLKKIQAAHKKPHGMILATGPTGSGKTTTLYSLLKLLNKRGVNIMTIEDPVEYDMEGVNQIQVNNKTELTFAKGLRSIVRQDPDIVLVGEIRDEETADIAVNAGMTGHLILSTLHTNDAATAFPRLLDMGVEPFLIASTVNVVIAQRLVRKIHPKCRVSQEVTKEEISKKFSAEQVEKIFAKGEKITVYQGKGCEIDHDTGYEGRVGIYEVLLVDDEIKAAITSNKSAAEIRQIAIQNGMRTMLEDGLEKVKRGITTLEEVMRVTKE